MRLRLAPRAKAVSQRGPTGGICTRIQIPSQCSTNLDQTPFGGLPLTTLPPSGDKPAIGAAGHGQQHISEQEEKSSCSARPWALRSSLVPGAVQMYPVFLPWPLPLCSNLERRWELLCSLPAQPGCGMWQRTTCPGAASGADFLRLGHRKRDFHRAEGLLKQPLHCSVYKDG